MHFPPGARAANHYVRLRGRTIAGKNFTAAAKTPRQSASRLEALPGCLCSAAEFRPPLPPHSADSGPAACRSPRCPDSPPCSAAEALSLSSLRSAAVLPAAATGAARPATVVPLVTALAEPTGRAVFPAVGLPSRAPAAATPAAGQCRSVPMRREPAAARPRGRTGVHGGPAPCPAGAAALRQPA